MRGRRRQTRKATHPRKTIQTNVKNDYRIHYGGLPRKDLTRYLFVSVDPAIDHYAFSIERRQLDVSGKVLITSLVIDSVALNTTVVDNHSSLIGSLISYLQQYIEYYKECSMFIVERQMEINPKAMNIFYATVSYFMTVCVQYNIQAAIVEPSAKLKGDMLGYQKGQDIKDWAIDKGFELLTARRSGMSMFTTIGMKLDDPADTLIQIEALLIFLDYASILTSNVLTAKFAIIVNR